MILILHLFLLQELPISLRMRDDETVEVHKFDVVDGWRNYCILHRINYNVHQKIIIVEEWNASIMVSSKKSWNSSSHLKKENVYLVTIQLNMDVACTSTNT